MQPFIVWPNLVSPISDQSFTPYPPVTISEQLCICLSSLVDMTSFPLVLINVEWLQCPWSLYTWVQGSCTHNDQWYIKRDDLGHQGNGGQGVTRRKNIDLEEFCHICNVDIQIKPLWSGYLFCKGWLGLHKIGDIKEVISSSKMYKHVNCFSLCGGEGLKPASFAMHHLLLPPGS